MSLLALQAAFQATVDIEGCRQAARTVLGEKYDETMAGLGGMISGEARREGDSILSAVIRMGRSGAFDRAETVMLIAAAAEMMAGAAK